MAQEIERKFLVDKSKLKLDNNFAEIKQGYIKDLEVFLFKDHFKIFSKTNFWILKLDQKDFKNLKKLFFDKDNKFIFNEFNVFRIRTINSNVGLTPEKHAFLTIKGKNIGITRNEYEYEINYEIALEILSICEELIEKRRYYKDINSRLWEIDVFSGNNEGLIIAEIELESESTPFIKPNFVLEEVSLDNRYFNNNLLKNPFKNWK